MAKSVYPSGTAVTEPSGSWVKARDYLAFVHAVSTLFLIA